MQINNEGPIMKEANKTLLLALWQVPLLMVVACLIALAVNYWRECSP
jgi:hypothetical protein